ncbi:MAG: hypothetical protein NBV67_00455 [Tagaea sp.]|nr:hypothetical protein [Tagaea sp.]
MDTLDLLFDGRARLAARFEVREFGAERRSVGRDRRPDLVEFGDVAIVDARRRLEIRARKGELTVEPRDIRPKIGDRPTLPQEHRRDRQRDRADRQGFGLLQKGEAGRDRGHHRAISIIANHRAIWRT